MAKRATGVVKWFNVTKGFGFITPDEGGGEIFVHQSSIKSDGLHSLIEGESVEYEIETVGDGKIKAVAVTGPGGSNVRGTDPRSEYEYYTTGGRIGGKTGYGGGRSGGSECYNCKQVGHMARECPSKGN